MLQVIRGIGRCAAKAHISKVKLFVTRQLFDLVDCTAKVVVNPRNAGNAKSLADEFPGTLHSHLASEKALTVTQLDGIFAATH